MEEKIYRNSLNFVPVDVAKGIDRTTGKMVNADDIDPNYERKPKCRYCTHFTLNKENELLGKCTMMGKDYLAYPDMVAITCKGYKERKNY